VQQAKARICTGPKRKAPAIVERIRMVSHDEIQDEFTMEDPVALTQPLQATFRYARVTDTDRMIDETECDSTNDRNPVVEGRFTSQTTR
jgi:hypothetical protein